METPVLSLASDKSMRTHRGAVLALFNPALRDKAKELARTVKVLDLAAMPEFQKIYLSSLPFPEKGKYP